MLRGERFEGPLQALLAPGCCPSHCLFLSARQMPGPVTWAGKLAKRSQPSVSIPAQLGNHSVCSGSCSNTGTTADVIRDSPGSAPSVRSRSGMPARWATPASVSQGLSYRPRRCRGRSRKQARSASRRFRPLISSCSNGNSKNVSVPVALFCALDVGSGLRMPALWQRSPERFR